MENEYSLKAKNLKPLAAMPQGLDNQYIPFNELSKISRGKSKNDIKKELSDLTRSEYLRSLLYAEQVIINRAYLINTPSLYQDFLSNSPSRRAFLELAENQVIVPMLFNETSLNAQPTFTVNMDGWKAVEMLENEKIYKVRLSWNDIENNATTNKLSKNFTNYVMGMRIIASQIADEFNIKDVDGFTKTLSEVTRFCLDEFDITGRPIVTRNQLYEKFICVNGTNISDGIYDIGKPFSLYLKMLFDLKYNVNLPDALGIQTFTGRGLPTRSILHEVDLMNLSGPQRAVDLDIAKLLSSIVIGELQQTYWLDTVKRMTLADIQNIRNNVSEWRVFINASKKIEDQSTKAVKFENVDDPIDFVDFQNAFINLQNAIAKLFPDEFRKETKPNFEIQAKFDAVTISLNPSKKTYSLEGDVSRIDSIASTFSTSIVSKTDLEFDLGFSYDFLATKISDARTQINNFLELIRNAGFLQTKTQVAINDIREGALVDEAEYYSM